MTGRTRTRAPWIVAALAWALLTVLGCGEGGDSAPAPAPTAAATPEATSPPATPEPAAPDAATPTAETASEDGDPARGEPLYGQYCASCHGARGEGDGPVAASLNPKPVRHSDGAYMNELSQENVFKVIKEGGSAVGKSPLMAPWGGTLTDAEIWDLVAFIRTLADPPYQP